MEVKKKHKILVIDDDPRVLEIVQVALPEYHFNGASTGDEALQKLQQSIQYDLVLLDYRLVEETGLDILRKIKQLKLNLGIIILTAYRDYMLQAESRGIQADGIIEKPISFPLLNQMIQRILKNIAFFKDSTKFLREKIPIAQKIVENYTDCRISLREISQKTAYNPKYLSRTFKEEAGETFTQCRLRLKVERAKKVLKMSPEKSILQLAKDLGYKNPSSFMKMFKKITGQTPSEFRQS